MRVWWYGIYNGISAVMRRDTWYLSLSLSLLCEDTGRRQHSASQEESSHQNSTIWYPDLRLLTSRTVQNKYLWWINHTVYGILLWQPRRTKTQPKLIQSLYSFFIPNGFNKTIFNLNSFLDHISPIKTYSQQ